MSKYHPDLPWLDQLPWDQLAAMGETPEVLLKRQPKFYPDIHQLIAGASHNGHHQATKPPKRHQEPL